MRGGVQVEAEMTIMVYIYMYVSREPIQTLEL